MLLHLGVSNPDLLVASCAENGSGQEVVFRPRCAGTGLRPGAQSRKGMQGLRAIDALSASPFVCRDRNAPMPETMLR